MTTSQELQQLSTVFYSQQEGLFPIFKRLPQVLEEIERREKAVGAKEARAAELDRAIEAKTHQLATLEETVRAKLEKETHRQRTDLQASIKADTERAEKTKTLADQETERLRTIHQHLTTIGLTPADRP